MFNRLIKDQIKNSLFIGKVIIIYGPRQVGKTTLVKEIIKEYPNSSYYLCESPDVIDALTNKTAKQMQSFFGLQNNLIILDEAQSVVNIGKSLKILADSYPELQIIATGSSSFDLANKLNEPLTGRYIDFFLYPFALGEISSNFNSWEIKDSLNRLLVTGLYPEVFLSGDDEGKKILSRIAESYLFKDILKFDNIRSSEKLKKLVRALALQLGNEVSLNELANLVGIDKNTVNHYIDILQKAFIVFKLSPLSRNLRSEINRSNKIYFYDLGIRNALINNFNPIDLRSDIGALFENFCIVERIKYNAYNQLLTNYYFWRTYNQQEIDLIEDREGRLNGYEFKWGSKIPKAPKIWLDTYENSSYKVINRENWLDFVNNEG